MVVRAVSCESFGFVEFAFARWRYVAKFLVLSSRAGENMTDPIGDMLTRIRNAILSRKDKLDVPASRIKERIAELLRDEGYVEAVARTEGPVGGRLTVSLRYGADNQSAIQVIRRVSRPGQRRYVRSGELPKVRSGLGVAILSTSRGILTDREARKLRIGGELLCEVW